MDRGVGALGPGLRRFARRWRGPVLGRARLIAGLERLPGRRSDARSLSQQLFGDHNFVFDGELKYLLGIAKKSNPA